MSYISAIKKRDDIIIWERTSSGREVIHKRAPYYFYIKDENGPYTSMFGDKLRKLKFTNSHEFNTARMEYANEGVDLYESDIPPELKLLSKEYYNVPAPNLNVTFIDIEVDYDKKRGFSSTEDPYAPVNSVALYHSWSNRMLILAVPPKGYNGPTDESEILKLMHEQSPLPQDCIVEIVICKDERDLLILLLDELEDSDIVSGWNSDFFDVPYLGKRLEMLGQRYFNKLSFDGANPPKWRTVEVFKREQETLDLSGRSSLDYMVLFKKYEMAERPSYKLESIADEILPDLPKLEYEGTLADLYHDDFIWFIRYNLRDTEILKGFEERLGYVELANQMCHLSTGLFSHVLGTLKLAELATINYCHHELDLIVKDNIIPEDDAGQIQGAFVLLPQVGLHENISSVDIASLYPSAIRSINISPETIIGQLESLKYEPLSSELKQLVYDSGYSDADYAAKVKKSKFVYAADLIASGSDEEIVLRMEDGTVVKSPAKTFRSVFKQKKWAVSGYGTVFDQNRHGIIPMILTDWYARRKQFKRKMSEAKNEMTDILAKYKNNSSQQTLTSIRDGINITDDDAVLYDELAQKVTYFDKLQYVYKIKLNSFYGALTNKYFRFYDLRMGESTTGTGRKILMHQCAEVCKHLDGKYTKPNKIEFEWAEEKGIEKLKWHYGYTSDYSVVYGDTDSSYFVTHTNTSDEATIVGDEIGNLINKSFQPFMRETFLCNDEYDNIIQCEREVVSDRGIFVDKKRYILHLVDLDGWKCDKIKVMGLDTKKTTLPKEVSAKLNKFIERYLKGETWDSIAKDIVDFKHEIETTDDIMSIGLPKGIQGLEEYTKKYKEFGDDQRLPGHVAASIFYNMCRKEFNDNESMEITSGMKIKVFYLDAKYGRFKSIAMPVDINQLPAWFLQNFTVSRKDHIQRLVDKPLNNIVKAIGETTPSRQSMYVKDVIIMEEEQNKTKKLYTSNYARKGGHPKAFAISVFPPDYYKGESLPMLAPDWDLVKAYKNNEISQDEYAKTYIQTLKDRGLNPTDIVSAIPDESYLLCYEKPSDFCHRHVLADWLRVNTDIEITEWKNKNESNEREKEALVDSLLVF